MAYGALESSARWIVSRLKAQGITRPIARGQHPFKGNFPMIVLTSYTPTDRYLTGLNRLGTRFVWRVVAVDKSWDTETIALLDADIDAALQVEDTAYDDTAGPYVVNHCYRENPFEDTQVVDNDMFRYLGGFYIVRLNNAP